MTKDEVLKTLHEIGKWLAHDAQLWREFEDTELLRGSCRADLASRLDRYLVALGEARLTVRIYGVRHEQG